MRRLQTRAQFQALLACRPVARTAHFALHRLYLPSPASDLSSAGNQEHALFEAAHGVWLGAMVPKRWARRAVTRNAIRRQIYAVGQHCPALLTGDGQPLRLAQLVRLRSAFARQQFPSASSAALKAAVRSELLQLLALPART